MQVLRRTRLAELRHLPRQRAPGLVLPRLPALASPLPALRRWIVPVGSRLLTLATGLAAAIPVLSSTVDAVRGGWVPTADRAIIATRALDVFTWHTPLIGQYSEAGRATTHVVHSPGPMLYWLLAPAARWGTSTSLPLTMGIVNTLAILTVVALARRRGGPVLMFAAAAGIALMCQSLATEDFHDMWNPAAGLLPFLALIFLCWSLSCGDYRLLPACVLVASFVTQTHLMYVLPTAALLAIGLGGLTVREGARRRRRRRGEDVPARRRWSVVAWSAAALVVAALCWSAPVIDEIEHNPGNLTLIAQTAGNRGSTVGSQVGWNAVQRAVGWRPWWLHEPSSRWNRKYDVQARPGRPARDTTLAMLAALVAVAAVAAMRRRGDVTAAAVIALALCAALGADAAATPKLPLLAATLGYTMWWGSILGLWVWLVLGWSLWLGTAWSARQTAALARRRLPQRRWRVPSAAVSAAPLCAALLCLGATALVGRAVVANAKTPDEHAAEYAPVAQISARLDQIVARGQTINLLQGALDWATLPIKPGVRYYLQQHGDLVLAQDSFQRLGDHYELGQRPYTWIVDVADGTRRPHKGLTPAMRGRLALAARSQFTDAWGPEVLSVWVARVPPPITSRTPCAPRCPRGPAAGRARRR